MPESTLYVWKVQAEPAVTASFREASHFLMGRGCCAACETFLEAVERPILPAELLEFLRRSGADPLRPQEVWGAPEGGFLNGWWVIGGRLVGGPQSANEGTEYAEPLPGFRLWVTQGLAMRRPEGFEDAALLQVEFLWNDVAVEQLGRAVWPLPTAD